MIIIDLLPSVTSYGINIKVNSKEWEETQELFNIKWELKVSLSEKTLAMDTKLMIESDSITADVKLNVINNKVKDHVFETPENVQSLDELIWGLLWGSGEIDDEDYVYDYDENYEEDSESEEDEEIDENVE